MSVWEKLQIKLENYWDILILKIPEICIGILVFCLFLLLATFVAKLARKRIAGSERDNKIVLNYIIKLVKFVMVTVGLILALHAIGFQGIAGGLLAGAGMGAIVIGFAFKEIGANFLAGMILVFDRPFDIGDTVTITDNMGKVQNLLFRTTHIKTFDGKDVFIPNANIITNTVYNHTRDGFLRHSFIIGIDYDDNIDKAREIILKAVNANSEVLKNEKSMVLINDFGTNTVNLQVLFWVSTTDYKVGAAETKFQIMRDVKQVLQEHQFGLPANIQEFKLYRKEAIPIQMVDGKTDK